MVKKVRLTKKIIIRWRESCTLPSGGLTIYRWYRTTFDCVVSIIFHFINYSWSIQCSFGHFNVSTFAMSRHLNINGYLNWASDLFSPTTTKFHISFFTITWNKCNQIILWRHKNHPDHVNDVKIQNDSAMWFSASRLWSEIFAAHLENP